MGAILESRLHDRPDPGRDLVGRTRRVHEHPTAIGREVAVRLAHGGVELVTGAFETVPGTATRASATASGRSSTITRSGARPPVAISQRRSTSSTPSPRATPWYAIVDGEKRSHTTITLPARSGRIRSSTWIRRSSSIHASSVSESIASPCSNFAAELEAFLRAAGLARLVDLVPCGA